MKGRISVNVILCRLIAEVYTVIFFNFVTVKAHMPLSTLDLSTTFSDNEFKLVQVPRLLAGQVREETSD